MTDIQKKLLHELYLTKVITHDDFTNIELGFATRGKQEYEIHLNDTLDEKAKDIVLIHEAAHIKLGHCKDVWENNKLEWVRDKMRKKGLHLPLVYAPTKHVLPNYSYLLNVAMDLEVNSKYLSFSDLAYMRDNNMPLFTPEVFGMDYLEDYSEYLVDILEHCYSMRYIEDYQDTIDSQEDCEHYVNVYDIDPSGGSLGNGKGENVLGEVLSESAKSEVDNVSASSDMEDESGNIRSNGGLGGTTESIIQETPIDDTERIKRFISSLFETKRVKNVDSMKLYNRGSRRNPDNIIYSSYSRKMKRDNIDLMFIIDVSGSMSTESINTALTSLEELFKQMNSLSTVVHWGNKFVQRYDVKEIGTVEKLRVTAGISYNCLDYAKEQGYKDVVIYSDFCDDGYYSFKDKAKGLNVYSIVKLYPQMGEGYFRDHYPEVCENSKEIIFIEENWVR